MIYSSGLQRDKTGGRKASEEIVAEIQVRNVGGLNMAWKWEGVSVFRRYLGSTIYKTWCLFEYEGQ